MRLTGECVWEDEWITDICISFGMSNHGYFHLPSKRTMYLFSLFLLSIGFVIFFNFLSPLRGILWALQMWLCV